MRLSPVRKAWTLRERVRHWSLLSKDPANKPPALPPANHHTSQDQPSLRVTSTPRGENRSHTALHTSVKKAAAQTPELHLPQGCSGALWENPWVLCFVVAAPSSPVL